MPDSKPFLRGDPARPFPTDMNRIEELLKQFTAPTHEPLWFYRVRGSCSPKEEARSKGYKSVENIEVMRELALQIPKRCEFFKGFGLERERPQIERVIEYARALHERDMLVSVYVGGTMFTEYFFKEVPEAKSWVRMDQNNQPVTYGSYQLNRWFPCLNHPDYLAYMKRVLDIAVDEIQADEIFFDNQILRYEPRTCRCEHCVRHLREMIRESYTLEQCERRYGLAEYPDSVPPVFSQANKPWRLDKVFRPYLQDWIDHRVKTVLDFYRTMADHVKARKPDTAVGLNIKGIHGHNRAFDHGICHGAAADLLDFSCIDGYCPGRKNDAVISEVRFWKSSHANHVSVVDENESDIAAVEGQVYGYKKKIEGHGWLGDLGNCSRFTPTTQFLRGNLGLYHERQRIRGIAVLRYEPATRYNCAKTHEQLMAFEQTLAVEKLPWGILFDRQRESLEEHQIVALPDIQALSDEWLDALDTFMRAGGGVIASGEACGYDEWYRPRDPAHAFDRWLGGPPSGRYQCKAVGKGRLVYVPEWEVHTRWSMEDWFAVWGANVRPVKDRALFLQAIQDASPDAPLAFRATGNDFVFLEGIIPEEGAGFGVELHFINYDRNNTEPWMEVRVALPEGRSGARVERVHADVEGHPREEVEAGIEGREIVFPMFTPEVYGLAKVRFS